MSRNGRDWTDHFPPVAAGVARLPAEQAFLDGEVTVLLPNGASSFQALQNFMSGPGKGELAYMIFDLVYLDGSDLTGAPLEERKAALAKLLSAARDRATVLRYSDHVVGAGSDFFEHACRMGLEGIVSKRRDAPYRGRRGAEWLKIKCLKRQEIVIGGYTDPEGSRVGIGALLGGVYEDGRLSYAGKIGTGFSRDTLRDLKKRLTALDQDVSPFTPRPTGVGRPHWVKPELVAEVSFSEWTSDGKLRHSTFLGLREDKPARAVVRELPADVERETGAAREAPPPKPSAKRDAARTRPESPARQPAARKRASESARSPARPRKSTGGGASGEAVLAGVRLNASGPSALSAAGDDEARSRALLRVDRRLDPAPPRGSAHDPRALSRRRSQAVLLSEARRVLGAGERSPGQDSGEAEGRSVPGRRFARGADRARADRHPRDPHVELGRGAARAARSDRLRSRPWTRASRGLA
jgi:bifunctional non-homologous end joining protein LigD